MQGGDNLYTKQAETNSAFTIHSDNNVDSTMQDVVISPQTTNVNTPNEVVNDHEKHPLTSSPPQSHAPREQDMYMPIANVVRMMRNILPEYAKISDDAKKAMQECVSEYIHFLTGEANIHCQREQRKIITAEDIIWAMKETGFDDYIGPITKFKNWYQEGDHGRPSAQNQPTMKRHSDGVEAVDCKSLKIDNVGPLGLGCARPLGMGSITPFGFFRPVGSMGPIGSIGPSGSVGPIGSIGSIPYMGSMGPVDSVRPIESIPSIGFIAPIEPIGPIGPLPSFGSFWAATYNMSPQPSFFDPWQMDPYNFKNNNSDSTRASSSQANLPEFELYAQFK